MKFTKEQKQNLERISKFLKASLNDALNVVLNEYSDFVLEDDRGWKGYVKNFYSESKLKVLSKILKKSKNEILENAILFYPLPEPKENY